MQVLKHLPLFVNSKLCLWALLYRLDVPCRCEGTDAVVCRGRNRVDSPSEHSRAQSTLNSVVAGLCELSEDIAPIAELLPIKAIATATKGIIYLKTLFIILHLSSIPSANVENNFITTKRYLTILRNVTQL